MKKNNIIWITLWAFVGIVGLFSIINDKRNKETNDEMALYTEKCYNFNYGKYISLEQMKYMANKRMTSSDIDNFSEKCGLILKEAKSNDAKHSSKYGFNDFEYHVLVIDNQYSFLCHSSTEYINKLRSDLLAEDNSATVEKNSVRSTNIEGLANVFINWDLNYGSVLVAITVMK